ncbi:hypothetical protein D3C71_1738100 [compost metagenome]
MDACASEVFAREFGEFGHDFQAQHFACLVGQQGGHIARAGADFQHLVGGLDLQVLQHARLDARRLHGPALGRGFIGRAVQRNLDVHEGHALVLGGDEQLAAHCVERVQHVLLQHVPGADLLLDHVVARLLYGIVGVG